MRAGRVGRPHGLDGSFHVAEAEAGVLVPGVVLEGLGAIVAVKGTEEHPILRIEGVADRTAAEALRGRELLVPDTLRPELGEDEYWPEQLVGCRVLDGDRELGVVQQMLGMPSCELLELGDGTLIPLVRDAIERVDVEAKVITVNGRFLGLAD